jgi:hypothetical protein
MPSRSSPSWRTSSGAAEVFLARLVYPVSDSVVIQEHVISVLFMRPVATSLIAGMKRSEVRL